MKKLAFILSAIIITSLSTPILANAAEKTETNKIQTRQWGQVQCPGINSCYGCSAFDCPVYKVQNITVTFSYDECIKVVERGRTASDVSKLASIIAGFKSKVTAGFLSLYSTSVSRNIEMFKTAINKNSGLELKAEYVINRNSYGLNRYRKGTKRYIPRKNNSNSNSVGYSRLLKVTSPLMYGADIKKVQSRLNQLGFNAGKVDGYYGNNTKNAVIRFQKSRKLSADGIVGPQTWNKLF